MAESFPLSQRDSYAASCDAEVISCEPCKDKGGKGLFELVLTETVLFAENGGQPHDFGTISGRSCTSIKSDLAASKPIHLVKGPPFNVGEKVHVEVDWNRRFDHMQQHSSQHVITAIASLPEFGSFKTVGWALLSDRSHVELELPPNSDGLNDKIIDKIESFVNQKIRESHKVEVQVYPDLSTIPQSIRSRGALPTGGPIRIVSIDTIDSCTCCGTHVKNTSELQCVKIIGTERSRQGCVRLVFLAGGRVLSSFANCLNREREIGKILTCSCELFVERISSLLNDLSTETKARKRLINDLAAMDAEIIIQRSKSNNKFIEYHRNGVGMEYLDILLQALQQKIDDNCLLLLTASEPNSANTCEGHGVFLLNGPQEIVSRVSVIAKEILVAKGGGKGRKIQGKAEKMQNRSKLVSEIASLF